MSASIPIVDDAINEATEQVFIAELRLVSSLDPTRVYFSAQPSILCRIIDDDCKYRSLAKEGPLWIVRPSPSFC